MRCPVREPLKVEALQERGLDSRAAGDARICRRILIQPCRALSLDQRPAFGGRDAEAYAKRQMTWARHQMPGFLWAAPEEAEKTALTMRDAPD